MRPPLFLPMLGPGFLLRFHVRLISVTCGLFGCAEKTCVPRTYTTATTTSLRCGVGQEPQHLRVGYGSHCRYHLFLWACALLVGSDSRATKNEKQDPLWMESVVFGMLASNWFFWRCVDETMLCCCQGFVLYEESVEV